MIDHIKAYFENKEAVFSHISNTYGMNSNIYERYCKKRNQMVHYNTYFKDVYNMYFKITNEKGFVENSLHSLYNRMNGSEISRNDNDFSYRDLLKTLDFLKNYTDYPLEKINLSQGLEFGFNLQVPFDVDNFIVNDCVFYGYKTHAELENTETKTFKTLKKGYYKLKIYNKGKQFNLSFPTLRIELRFLDKRGFNNLGIYTLHDLSDQENLKKIYDLMYDEIKNHLLIVDNIEVRGFSDFKNKKLYRYTSSKFWQELPRIKTKIEKQKFYKMLEKNNLLTNKKMLLSLMESKFYQLINN